MKLGQYRLPIIVVSVVFGLTVVYALGIGVRQRSGIRVEIRNLSSEELRNVSIKVEGRGNRYRLPDIKPGEKKQIFVEPITESHITVDFIGADGDRRSKVVVGYAEAGYCGSAVLTVLPGYRLESNEDLSCWTSWFDFI